MAYFSNASREVLDKKLAEVVQGVELMGLQFEERGNGAVKAVKEYLVDELPPREPNESRQQIMTHDSLLQPFEVLL